MGKIVQFTEEEISARLEAERKTPEYKARMERLANIRDEDIDFSDIPEWTDEQFARATRPGRGGVRPGAGRPRSNRVPLTLRLRPSVARHLRAIARREETSISAVAERALAAL